MLISIVHILQAYLVIQSVAVKSFSKIVCIRAFTEGSESNGCNSCDRYGNLSHELSHEVEDHTELRFCGSRTRLFDLIHITHKTDITLHGLHNQSTTVHCQHVGQNGPGFMFTNITELHIASISFHGCGFMHKWLTIIKNTTIPFMASIYIYNSKNVHISHVRVEDGNGTGLAIIDTTGLVNITYSMFKNNSIKINSSLTGGRGVYVDFTYCPPGTDRGCEILSRNNRNSTYVFSHSMFEANNAIASRVKKYFQTPLRYKAQKKIFQEVGNGGGLTLYIRADATSNNIMIENCSFLANEAKLGGGLILSFHDSPKNNVVVVRNCTFQENVARNGGGGLDVGFLAFGNHLATLPTGNKLVFDHCSLMANFAKYGGGTKIFSTRSFSSGLNNSITFTKCQWEQNKAQFGSAVEISPQVWDVIGTGYFPMVEFKDCNFSSNFRQEEINTNIFSANYTWGKGTFLTTAFPVAFSGKTLFSSGNSSALYVSSASIDFAAGSHVEFKNNTAYEGGAVALIGFSALHVRDNSTFLFIRNKALSKGGAIIYQSSNTLDFVSSRSCFIQYVGDTKSVKERGINIFFQENKVDVNGRVYGNTIYATTVSPCKRGCFGRETIRSAHGLNCIGNFEFMNAKPYEISTSGARFIVQRNYTQQPVGVIPGQEIEFQFQLVDDLNNETFDSYHVLLKEDTDSLGSVKVDPVYRYITDKTVRLYGNSGDIAYIQLGTTGIREITISFKIQMKQCPLGYVIQMNYRLRGSECVCSANTPNKTYVGIEYCNQNELKAYLKHSYWFGYDGDEETEETLKSGRCPRGFCFGNQSKVSKHLVPSNISLSRFVCSEYRQGKLCGGCIDNYSHYFHSENFKCFSNNHCNMGLVLYIVSELIPVTILFMVVIFFNVNLTSGAVNGFVFFIQFIDTMLIDANGFIPIHPTINVLMLTYKFVYGMFNLNFFTLDSLSFCLWKEASILDILAFKYVTIVYSLLLVTVTVLLMKVYNITRLKRSLFKCILSSDFVKGTVIHGFSTFFVMCYSQCTKVTLFLLTPSLIYSIGPPNKQPVTKVVFYGGDFLYFDSDHLKYAIPALCFAVTLILVPPTLLIVYPLCYRLFALVGLEDSRFVQISCKILPLEKIKPLFDSFQSCFKDNYRFFSGLYFLYRLVALISFVVFDSLTKFYIVLEVQLVIMFALHAATNAYKKHWHNILDTLLFANLAIINALTMYNYKITMNGEHLTINILSIIQTFLVLLPMLYMITYLACSHLKSKSRKCNKRTQDDLTDTLSLIDYQRYQPPLATSL